MILAELGFDLNTMIIFAFIGLGIKLFFGGLNEQSLNEQSGPANATVWGYSLTSLALLVMMVLTFALTSQKEQSNANLNKLDQGSFRFVWQLFSQSMPSVVTLIVLLWIIAMNASYSKRINLGQVSTDFYRFSNASTIMLILQIYVLFNFFKKSREKDKDPDAARDANRLGFAIYFLTFLNLLLTGITNIELKFFSTDG